MFRPDRNFRLVKPLHLPLAPTSRSAFLMQEFSTNTARSDNNGKDIATKRGSVESKIKPTSDLGKSPSLPADERKVDLIREAATNAFKQSSIGGAEQSSTNETAINGLTSLARRFPMIRDFLLGNTKEQSLEEVSDRTDILPMKDIRPPDHLLSFYNERAPEIWNWIKEEYGYPVGFDYPEALRQHEKKLVENAEIYQRISPKGLIDILRSPSDNFLQTFESSQDSPKSRGKAEDGLFGYHKSISYGYLSADPVGHIDNASELDMYGSLVLRFKRKEIENYVTFTMEDSINLSDGRKELWAIPSRLVDPNGCSFPLKVMYRSESGRVAFFEERNDDPLKHSSIQSIFPFAEAQIHMPLNLAMVEEVIFTHKSNLTIEAAQLLASRGIRYCFLKKTPEDLWSEGHPSPFL